MSQLYNILQTLSIDKTDLRKNEPNWLIFYVNGIKMEVKTSRKGWGLVAAYDDEDLSTLIKDEFPGALDTKGARYWFDTYDELESIASQINDLILEQNLQQQRGSATLKTSDDAYFEKTAAALKAVIDAEAFDFLTRHTFDQHDELITIRKSQAVLNDPTAPTWREHIVPCTLLLAETVRMVQAGCTIPQLAQMLKQNLAIVIITAEEAKRLDSVYQTTMPANWNFGDNVFARLDAMNIAY